MSDNIIRSITAAFVGNRYHWEPTKYHASEWVEVVEVEWRKDEVWVTTMSIDKAGNFNGPRCHNELGRFIEAVTINDVISAV